MMVLPDLILSVIGIWLIPSSTRLIILVRNTIYPDISIRILLLPTFIASDGFNIQDFISCYLSVVLDLQGIDGNYLVTTLFSPW